jgi:hypothetical protein
MKLDQFQGCFDRDGLLYGLAQGGLTGLFVNLVWLQPTTLLIGLFADYILLQPATARAADVDFRCGQSSLNPSCPAYQVSEQPTDVAQEPTRSETKPDVIKFKLNDLSGVSEWIRAEIMANQIKLRHTVVTESGLSKGLTSMIGGPIAIGHTWYDHPTSRIAFQPDGCERSDCLVSGTDSITLPIGTNLYQGRFTLEYSESGWLRTIVFKLPDQQPSPTQSSSQPSSQPSSQASAQASARHRPIISAGVSP